MNGLVENSHWLWSYLGDVRLTFLDPQPSGMVCTSPTSHHQQPRRCGPVGSPVEADRQQANVQRQVECLRPIRQHSHALSVTPSLPLRPRPPPTHTYAHDVGWTVEDTVMTKRMPCADGEEQKRKEKKTIYITFGCVRLFIVVILFDIHSLS